LPEKYRNWATRVFLRQPIAEIVELAATDTAKGTRSCPWPQHLVIIVGSKIKAAIPFRAKCSA
jgi:hypothetical protein